MNNQLNILYLTDDRSAYKQGYYYTDWIDVFQRHHHVTLFGPDFLERGDINPNEFDLLVYGHAAFDITYQWAQNQAKSSPDPGWTTKGNGYPGLDLARVTIPKIMFTKNDYKNVTEKIEFYKKYNFAALFSFTSLATTWPEQYGIKAFWLPFGVNTNVFENMKLPRDIDIGFRGNAHQTYVGDLRLNFAQALNALTDRSQDIFIGTDGEGFLFGDEYVRWLNRCILVGNTKSALDIVNPKFLESMACGAVPVSPIDSYENLLEPNRHYLAVTPDFSNVRSQINRFFSDADFREFLQAEIAAYAARNTMENRYRQLWHILESEGVV